jgi:hypothetical protein
MSTSIGKVPTRTRPPRSPAASARRCGRAALPRLPQATGPPGHFDPRPGRSVGALATVPMLTEPASAQRDAFDFLGVPDTPTLK